MKRRTWSGFVMLSLFLSATLGQTPSLGADPLRYQFKDVKNPIYQVSIRVELPDAVETHTGTIAYDIDSVDPSNGQVTFKYTSVLRTEKKQTAEAQAASGSRFPMPPRPPMPRFAPAAPMGPPQIVIDPDGTMVRSNRALETEQLPFLLGYNWQLLLPPLSQDDATWKTKGIISIFSKKQQQDQWPAPPWQNPSEERVDRSAHEVVVYTRGEPQGKLVPIQRQYTMTSDEKVDNNPYMKYSGDGQILFDPTAGLVQSMELKQTIELNQKNVTIKIPVEVKAHLMTPEELAKYKADQEAAQADAKAAMEKFRLKNAEDQKNDVSQLPAGATKTDMIGHSSGSLFTQVDPQQRALLGFRYINSKFGGQDCIRKLTALYAKSSDKLENNEKIIMAKDGYVVGGVIVNGKEIAYNVRVIFVRMKDGQIDSKDTYMSPWLNGNTSGPETQLAGKGEKIIGIYGRIGLNCHGMGLVIAEPKSK